MSMQKYELDNLKQQLNEHVSEFLTRDGANRGYICPICGNGSGRNGTGLEYKSESKLFACYGSCGGKFYSALDLLGAVKNLREKNQFPQLLDEAQRIAGTNYTNGGKRPQNVPTGSNNGAAIPGEGKQKTTPTTPVNEKWVKMLQYDEQHNAAALEYMERRGIPADVCKRFRIGFASEYGKEKRPGVVIPNGRNFGDGYVVRFIDDKKPKCASNSGTRHAWNPQAIADAAKDSASMPSALFIVEGEINGMTLETLGAHAVAIGGTNEGQGDAGRVTSYFKEYGGNYPAPVVLCLDDDSKGRPHRAEYHSILEPLGVFVIDAEPLPGNAVCNDAGEYEYRPDEEIKDLNDVWRETKDGDNHDTLTEWALQQLNRANAERDAVKERTLDAYKVDDALSEIETGTIAKNTPTMKSGFSRLDAILNNGRGFAPAVVLIGGEPGSGKTTFAMQLADYFAGSTTKRPDGTEQQNDILVFSLEMSRADLVARSLSKQTAMFAAKRWGAGFNAANWDRGAIDTISVKWARDYIAKDERDGGFNDDQKRNLVQAIAHYKTNIAGNMFVYEPVKGEKVTLNVIEREVKKFQEIRGRAPVVFIDYLQLLKSDNPDQTDKQVMDDIMPQLEILKKTYNTTFFLISALNRMSYGKESTLGGFRESSTIEYSADVALVFELLGQSNRKFDKSAAMSETPRKMVLNVLKNRQGPIGAKLHYDYFSAYNVFVEKEPRKWEGVNLDDDDDGPDYLPF